MSQCFPNWCFPKWRFPMWILGLFGLLGLFAMVASTAAFAVGPASRIQVHLVTGATLLTAGSLLELRIYEPGRPMRHFPLTHGEAWPRDSTRLISLELTEPLEPRTVSRFSLYYHAASPLTPPFEVVAFEVELEPGRSQSRLLDTSLSGTLVRQGEIMSDERDVNSMACAKDADCDDNRQCNGHERCAPRAAGADSRGCVKGTPLVCPVNEICSERQGCRGLEPEAAK